MDTPWMHVGVRGEAGEDGMDTQWIDVGVRGEAVTS